MVSGGCHLIKPELNDMTISQIVEIVFHHGRNFKPLIRMKGFRPAGDGELQVAAYNACLAAGGVGGGVNEGTLVIATEHNGTAMGAQVKNIELVFTSQIIIEFALE